jgi:hypothetical protein
MKCEFNGVKPKFAVLWVVTCDLLCYFQLCEFIVGCEFVKNVLSNRFNLFHILK